jgi:MFS superfamily sulfate permease-like transporter
MTIPAASKLPDLLAGISMAGLLLPEAVAYSGLANLPPQAGVVALFAGLVCYGLIGRSRFAIVSATSSSAAVLAAATHAVGNDAAQRIALASILVAGAGVVLIVAGSLRLGAMSNLIARPVLRGYAFGLAVVIAVKQWPLIVGTHAQASGFLPMVFELLRGIGGWHGASLLCGLLALVVLVVAQRVNRVPGALVVIVASILASPWLAQHGVALIGPIDLAPSLPAFALPPTEQWLPLTEFALALMFILYAESYGSIRFYALKHDDAVQPNRDLVALGVANLIAGLLQGTPVGAGYSATSANEAAGAQSRRAGAYAAATVLLFVLLFLRFIERIPQPVLGAIVIHAVSYSLRIGAFRTYFIWQRDRLVALAAVAAVLAFGVLDGLLAAVAFSLIMLLRLLANPRLSVLGRAGRHDYVSVERYPQATIVPHLLVLRPEERLFFGNAEPLHAMARDEVLRRPDTALVVLSLEESPDLDSTAIETLGEFCAWLALRGIGIRVARLKESARDALQRADLPPFREAAFDYSSVDDAVRGEGVRFESE